MPWTLDKIDYSWRTILGVVAKVCQSDRYRSPVLFLRVFVPLDTGWKTSQRRMGSRAIPRPAPWKQPEPRRCLYGGRWNWQSVPRNFESKPRVEWTLWMDGCASEWTRHARFRPPPASLSLPPLPLSSSRFCSMRSTRTDTSSQYFVVESRMAITIDGLGEGLLFGVRSRI